MCHPFKPSGGTTDRPGPVRSSRPVRLAPAVMALLAGCCLAACNVSGLADNPPPESLAFLESASLPSLVFTGMLNGLPEEEGDTVRGTLSVRPYLSPAPGQDGTAVPDSTVVQQFFAAFRTRGQSSQGFPKKSLALELRDPYKPLNSRSAALAGLPAENDFVLHSLYSDKSMMRNLLAFRLGAAIQDWAPRTKFVEVWGSQPDGDLGTSYQGIYLLMEKIKIDRHRVNLARMSAQDNAGEAVTGGYLLRIDWYSASDWYPGTRTRNLAVVEPDALSITPAQQAWITGYLTELEDCLRSTPVGNWRAYLDEASFIDFFLLNELMENVDGYRLSTFMSKDRNGKIKAGPLWDFDLSAGNDWRAVAYDYWVLTSQLDPDFNDMYPAFWWCELLHDAAFRTALRSRWQALRQTTFSDQNLESMIDTAVAEVSPAVERNYARWPALTINDPNWWTPMPLPVLDYADSANEPAYSNPEAYTYQDHVTYFEYWLSKRTAWMDSDAAWQLLEDFATNHSLHMDYVE